MEVGAILWLLTVSSGIGAEKFVVIQDKSSIVATEGETVDIPCRHNVTIKIWSYHWVKGARNGIKVTSESAEYRDRFLRSPGGDLSNNSTDVSMRLKYVRPSDSGMYFCKLETIEWEMYGAGTNLTVRGIGAEKFVVIQDKSSIVATEGETVDIPCRHNVTNRVWSYHWFKGARNGTEVTNETAEYRDRFLRPQGDDLSTNSIDVSLRLKYVQPSDSGMYFCKLKAMKWKMYGTGTNLTVRGKSRSFTVTQGQSSIFVAEGETVLMVCSHNANHSGYTGFYSWYRNTAKVSNGTAEYAGRVLGPDQEDSFKASIKLVDVRESDSGMYHCKVRIDGIGEAIGEGVQLTVSHTRKLKPVTILLVILLATFGIQGSILLVSILFRRRICSVENSVLVQSQELSTLNNSTTAADLISPQLDEGPGTAQDGNAPPCPELPPEGESIYAPMQNLKTFSISTDNGTDVSTQCRPNNSPVPDGEVPTVESIQYTVIYPSSSKSQAPAKTSVEDDDLEKDYGYDELNVTAKRSLQAKGDTNQEDGTVNQQIVKKIGEEADPQPCSQQSGQEYDEDSSSVPLIEP